MYRPWTMRTIGVEMETRPYTTAGVAVSREQIVAAIRANGVDARLDSYSGQRYTANQYRVKPDGSCGHEVVSPPLELDEDGHCESLRQTCAALNALAMKVDQNCGLHVHVYAADLTWQQQQQLLAIWIRFEPFFFECCPASRRVNTFCSPLVSTQWGSPVSSGSYVEQALRARTETQWKSAARYLGRGALNFQPLVNVDGSRTGCTVEFRLQHGSIQYEKIRTWAVWCASIVQRVQNTEMNAIRLQRGNSAQRSQRTIGYSTTYIARNIGLLTTWGNPEVPACTAGFVRWMDERRRRMSPRSHWAQRPIRGAARTAADPAEATA
jgi:hypothetical protein